MKLLRNKCALCGLQILQRVGGWEHFNTVAGRKAEADHNARPPKRSTSQPSGVNGAMDAAQAVRWP